MWSYSTKPHLDISNVVRNLVLYLDVTPFSCLMPHASCLMPHASCLCVTLCCRRCKKGGIWVLRDEISHYVRNDRGGLGSPYSTFYISRCHSFVSVVLSMTRDGPGSAGAALCGWPLVSGGDFTGCRAATFLQRVCSARHGYMPPRWLHRYRAA